MDPEHSYKFPRDLQPIPGTLTSDNYTRYITALSSFLRRGPRRYLLTDATTIAESSIGRNITIQQLRRLLNLHEILPEEAFYVFVLLGGGNYFDLLLSFDLAYPNYYNARTSEASLGETCFLSFFFILLAALIHYLGAVITV